MTVQQFRTARDSRPFKPFKIRTASGEAYHVTHPENVWQSPGGETVIVAIKDNDGESVVMLDVQHITEFVYPRRKRSG
ncbi:MAG TPA: hypothetical protein VGH33_27510 [Isosphaeraceae bacterium]